MTLQAGKILTKSDLFPNVPIPHTLVYFMHLLLKKSLTQCRDESTHFTNLWRKQNYINVDEFFINKSEVELWEIHCYLPS